MLDEEQEELGSEKTGSEIFMCVVEGSAVTEDIENYRDSNNHDVAAC